MLRYVEVLRVGPFAALWFGSTVSAVGDALTWVALVWLVMETAGSPGAVGGLVVASTAPVIGGGLAMGVLLDRFDRRRVLVVVNAVLGCAVASVPVLAHAGLLRTWHLYGVAALYGLLKMANWAGVPSLIPALLPERDLGVVVLWNSTSGVPSGLVPTILDGALGLSGDWLDVDEDDVDLLYASRLQSTPSNAGSDASTSRAKPR